MAECLKLSLILIPNGSLATTHKEQRFRYGLFGGFGWKRMMSDWCNLEMHLGAAGISLKSNNHRYSGKSSEHLKSP